MQFTPRFILAIPIVLFTILLFTNHSMADERCPTLKTPFTAIYYGSYKGWRVDATQKLSSLPDKRWQFTLYANNPVAIINEQSVFTFEENQKIRSERYQNERKILIKTTLMETVFDWKALQATSTRGDRIRQVKLQGGELDTLNYQLALRCDLLAGKTEFRYNVVDRKEIDTLEFKVVGEQILSTELGNLNTVIVKRIRNNENRITTLWFAKDRDYQMVKLLQEEKKDTEAYLLYIKSLSIP